MERLTTDKDVSEMGMFELAHNSCYIKDGKARYRDYDLDIDARELTRKLLKDHAGEDDAFTCDEDFDEWMVDYMIDGIDSIEGIIALFYRNLWAMADLRKRLKLYEDAEEQGLLLRLPCKVGDTVYIVTRDFISEYTICSIEIYNEGLSFNCRCEKGIYINTRGIFTNYDIGKTVFLTKEDAEQSLKQMESEE